MPSTFSWHVAGEAGCFDQMPRASLLSSVEAKNLPQVREERTFTAKRHAYSIVISQVIAYLVCWGCIFFSSLHQHNLDKTKKIAWWSFAFIGSFIGQWGWLSQIPSSITRKVDGSIVLTSLGGFKKTIKLSAIKNFQLETGCCSTFIVLILTPEAVETYKKMAGCCSCCIRERVPMHLDDKTDFMADLGLVDSVA